MSSIARETGRKSRCHVQKPSSSWPRSRILSAGPWSSTARKSYSVLMKRVIGGLRSDVPSRRDPGMQVKTIAVIGAGTMGREIAYAAAFGGFNTVLEDILGPCLKQALVRVRKSFE